MSRYVAISQDGKVDIHIPDALGGHRTLCGIDGDDPEIGQTTVPVPPEARISCRHCYAMWVMANQYSLFEFNVKE